MKNLFLKIILILLFTIFTNVNSFAQNSINGVVFDSGRNPVAQVYVELLDELERLIRSTETKSSGLYVFQDLPAGIYFVQIRTAGTPYKSAKERIQLGEGNRTSRTTGATSGSESVQLNFTLEIDNRHSENFLPTVNEVVFAQEIPKEAENLYRQAIAALANKKQTEAAASLNSAIKIFPDYFLALDRLGNLYLTQSKFSEAENILKRALDINPKSYSSRYGLAAAQYKLEKKTEAVKSLEEAVNLNPSSINAFFLLGKTERELKEFEKAETNLLKAKKLSNNSLADVHWELALLYYHNLKRYNEAADELELYLKANPKAENKEQVKKLIKTFRTKAKEEKP